MAIVGLGTDIVEIARIEKVATRLGSAFFEHILTPTELARCQSLRQPHRFLAKRFAAKEAAAKALGTGIAKGVTFQDFTVTNNELGQPMLTLSGQALVLAEHLGVTSVHLTLADEKQYAVATVILEI